MTWPRPPSRRTEGETGVAVGGVVMHDLHGGSEGEREGGGGGERDYINVLWKYASCRHTFVCEDVAPGEPTG